MMTAPPTLRHFLLVLAVLSFGMPGGAHAAEDWHPVQSKDGRVRLMMPGKAEKRTIVNRTIGGKVTSYNFTFHGDDVLFDLSYSKLPKLAIKFASADYIFKNAKGKVLHEAYGKETAFETVIIGGHEARLLRYDGINHGDPEHGGYWGMALFFIVDNTLYVANAAAPKGTSGKDELQKFRESIVIAEG